MSLIEPAHNSPSGNPNAYIGRPLAKERWKKMHRLGSRPPNRALFLGISLLVHGAMFLGLEVYWPKIAEQPLQTQSKTLTPVKFVEVPADRLGVKPPLNAKLRAINNSRGGGKARRDLPIETGTLSTKSTVFLPSIKPSSTKSKLSTPQPRQANTPPQQRQLAQRPEPLSQATNNLNSSPPASHSVSKPQQTHQPHQVNTPPQLPRVVQNVPTQPTPQPRRANTPPQPQSVAQAVPDPQLNSPVDTTPQPSPVAQNVPKPQQSPQPRQTDTRPQQRQPALRPEPSPQIASNADISSTVDRAAPNVQPTLQQRQPTTRHDPLWRTSYIPNNNLPVAQNTIKSVPSPQPRQHRAVTPQTRQPTPNRGTLQRTSGKPNKNSSPVARTAPELKPRLIQPSRQTSQPLGGTVTLASRSFSDYSGNEFANSNRLSSEVQGVDAKQDDSLGPYRQMLQQKIAQKYREIVNELHIRKDQYPGGVTAKVGFALTRSGVVTDLHIDRSSGSKVVDEAAEEAVRRAAPFRPIPDSYPEPIFTVGYEFNLVP